MVFRSLSYRSISRRSGWGKAWVSVATVLVGSILPVTTVASAAGPIVVEVRVGAGADDAEEAPSGSVNLTSSDLELTFANGDQVVGMRFANLAVPQGASIVSAYVQFQADEESFGETTLTIEGEAVDDAATFSSVDGDISVRPRTTSSVVWSPPPWTTVGEAGSAQRTEDVASVIQEIVDRPGWAEGARFALIITGTGDRVAESFNGVAAAAALLHVEYLSAVTVLASDARATEGSVPSDDGVFTVTRGGPTDDALTVSYTVGGDATAGSDYVALSGSVTIPAGAASAIVTVTPLDDTETEGSEDVTLTVIDGTDYVARSPATATIAILDAAAVVVSVLAGDGIAVEGSVPTDEGVFTLTRTGSTANATAVSYLVGGDASDGSDYVALPNSVTLPAGAASVDVPVTPIDDTATEGSESVTLTVIDGADYLAGSPATATITIVDDDQTVELRVATGPDDAEEDPSGNVDVNSRDLDLGLDASTGSSQLVGVRFEGLEVPQGATISKAHIQFRADDIGSSPSQFTIAGEAVDDAAPFVETTANLSSRVGTVASTSWLSVEWTVEGEEGPNQRTSDVSAIVQEIVSRPGWAAGNAAAFFISGAGQRVAVASDRSAQAAPLLHIEFSVEGPPVNAPPQVDARTDAVAFPGQAVLDGTVSDDFLPQPPGVVTVAWSAVSGPGTVTFGDAAAVDTVADFSQPGIYTLRLTASDGDLVAFEEVTLAVTDPSVPASSVVRLAAFGDYGAVSPGEAAVASLVTSLDPDAIITTGDNSYGAGEIDDNIGQYYSSYIGSYDGAYGEGSPLNRFFPSLGNHDHADGGGLPAYLDYFSLPGGGILTSNTSGNERYYDAILGPVHIFAIDSDNREPDGNDSTSLQAQWLQAQLAASTAPWKIVTLHHPPYSSGLSHGSIAEMQWPYEEWGADAVLGGHDHNYERLIIGGFPYFVTGLGGKSLNPLGTVVPGSEHFYTADYGTMLITACATSLEFAFHSVSEGVVDTYTLGTASCAPEVTIAQPLDGAGFLSGTSIDFVGSADDAEDGDVTSSLVWTSDLEGSLGSGASFSRSDLSTGTHLITATATDQNAQTGRQP